MDLSINGRGRARGERVRDLWMVDVDHSSHRWRAKKKRNVFPLILDYESLPKMWSTQDCKLAMSSTKVDSTMLFPALCFVAGCANNRGILIA